MFRKFTSERVRKARRQRVLALSVIYTLLGLSVFLVLWQLSYVPFMRIDTVSVVGTKALTYDEIFEIVAPHLSGAYGHVFSKRNVWLYPENAIRADFKKTFPRIDTLTLDIEDTHTLRITVTEREPKALLCEKNNETECYFIDADGLVLAEAPQFSGDSYVTYSATLADNPLGRRFLASSGFASLHAFVHSLSKLSLFPRDVTVLGDSFEIVVRVQLHTVHIVISATLPFEESYRNLEAILHEEDFNIESVSRIDLRFGNKVFFEERIGETGVSESLQSLSESSELRPL